MAAICQSSCSPWLQSSDLCDPCLDNDAITDETKDRMIGIASDLLFERTGRRFPGFCRETIRPCASSCSCVSPTTHGSYADNFRYDPATRTQCCGSCYDSCSCRRIPEIKLPVTPVVRIDEVKVDGVILDPSAYRIDNHQFLVRLGGERWPSSQDLLADDTEPNTFSVQYVYGTFPPPAGVLAASVLACELILACTPGLSGKCRLPRNVTSVSRQGISFQLLRDSGILNLATGIAEIDFFIQTYAGPKRNAQIFSPDTFKITRRVNT